MKKILATLTLSILVLNSIISQTIIPKPNEIVFEKGSFTPTNNTSIYSSDETNEVALIIQDFLQQELQNMLLCYIFPLIFPYPQK